MKNRLLPITIATAFALVPAAWTQEKTASQPSPSPSATASPKAAAAASPSPAASPTPAPASSPAASASPAAGTSPSPSATPDPAAKNDADFLPEPTDASLGAPIENKDEPLPSGEAAPSDLPNPDNLIPDSAAGGGSDEPPAPPAPAVAAENKFDKERKLEIRYQQVKLQALKDADIRNFHEQADAAKTDETKRQALRAYYRALFAKMSKLAPELQDKNDLMLKAYLRRLGQFRVSPAIPLKPPPTPEPLAN